MRIISMWQVCRGLTRPYKSVNALRSRRKTRTLALDWLARRTLLSNVSWTGTADGKSRPNRQGSRSQAFAARRARFDRLSSRWCALYFRDICLAVKGSQGLVHSL
jgi:hypothetical protein